MLDVILILNKKNFITSRYHVAVAFKIHHNSYFVMSYYLSNITGGKIK